MNKKWIIFIFIILFMNVSLASDLDITLDRQNYKQYQTAIFSIKSNVDLTESLQLSQISIYDAQNNKKSVALHLTEISKSEYIGYFDISNIPYNNYSFTINGVEYFKEGKLNRNNFKVYFNVIDGKENILNIFPGTFYKKIDPIEEPWIDFTFKNKGTNTLTFTPSVNNNFLVYSDGPLTLVPNQDKTIRLKTKIKTINQERIEGYFLVLDYSVPLIFIRNNFVENTTPVQNTTPIIPIQNTTIENLTIIQNITQNTTIENLTIIQNITQNTTIENKIQKLEFIEEYTEINKEISQDSEIVGSLEFKNTGNVPLTNLSFILTDGLDQITILDKSELNRLEPDEINYIDIKINSDKKLDKSYNGYLIIKSSEGTEAMMSIIITYIPTQDATIKEPIKVDDPKNPSLGCIDTSQCAEGLECINSECVINQKTNWILYIVIFCLVALAGFIIFFYFKSKKSYTELKK